MKENKIKKKVKDTYYKYINIIQKNKFNKTDFSIISNNCFGGIIYRNNHIPYQSPTCGLFFMAGDYIKFIYNMDKYLNKEIKEIDIKASKNYDYLIEIKYDGIVGVIDDIEIYFLHYDNINEVNEKWKRRCKRINYKRLIYKFNDQNLCTYEDLKAFHNFKADNKICFTSKKYIEFPEFITLEQYSTKDYVVNDTREKDYKKYFNIYNYINNIK